MEIDMAQRYIMDACMHGRHGRCPVLKLREIHKNDDVLGRIGTGKYARFYCECPCHAENKLNRDFQPERL